MILFCIPYAGGTAAVYDGVAELLGPSINVAVADLPGRGARFGESLIADMSAMTEVLLDQVEQFSDQPLAIFGYSAGAAMAYSLAVALVERGRRVVRLFTAAAPGAHLNPRGRALHLMADNDLIRTLHEFGGATPEMLNNPEILRIFLPIIRSDAQVVETYRPEVVSVECPVVAIGGSKDARVSIDELAAWTAVGDSGSEVWVLDGGHFVLHTRRSAIWRGVRAELEAVHSGPRAEFTESVR